MFFLFDLVQSSGKTGSTQKNPNAERGQCPGSGGSFAKHLDDVTTARVMEIMKTGDLPGLRSLLDSASAEEKRAIIKTICDSGDQKNRSLIKGVRDLIPPHMYGFQSVKFINKENFSEILNDINSVFPALSDLQRANLLKNMSDIFSSLGIGNIQVGSNGLIVLSAYTKPSEPLLNQFNTESMQQSNTQPVLSLSSSSQPNNSATGSNLMFVHLMGNQQGANYLETPDTSKATSEVQSIQLHLGGGQTGKSPDDHQPDTLECPIARKKTQIKKESEIPKSHVPDFTSTVDSYSENFTVSPLISNSMHSGENSTDSSPFSSSPATIVPREIKQKPSSPMMKTVGMVRHIVQSRLGEKKVTVQRANVVPGSPKNNNRPKQESQKQLNRPASINLQLQMRKMLTKIKLSDAAKLKALFKTVNMAKFSTELKSAVEKKMKAIASKMLSRMEHQLSRKLKFLKKQLKELTERLKHAKERKNQGQEKKTIAAYDKKIQEIKKSIKLLENVSKELSRLKKMLKDDTKLPIKKIRNAIKKLDIAFKQLLKKDRKLSRLLAKELKAVKKILYNLLVLKLILATKQKEKKARKRKKRAFKQR